MAAFCAASVTWIAFGLDTPVPLLDHFDLGIHELGHLVAFWAPDRVMFIAGSVVQVGVPLALAWYFWWLRRDYAGGGFCLAWAGSSAWDVSVYIADAPIQALPLIGGGTHDWAYLLGPQGWDAIHLSDEIASFVEFAGLAAAIIGIGLAVRGAITGLTQRPLPAPAEEEEPTSLAADPWLEAAKLPFKHEAA